MNDTISFQNGLGIWPELDKPSFNIRAYLRFIVNMRLNLAADIVDYCVPVKMNDFREFLNDVSYLVELVN